jgi:four helix bundle protein
MGYPDKKVNIHERTFDFAVKIVEFCRTLDNVPSNWVLSKQLSRSGTSIGANVEEAQAGQSKADFISKMSIGLKECRETNFWLRVIRASNASDSDVLIFLIQESSELMKIIATIIKNSRS